MSHRLSFKVISLSSEDIGMPARGLLQQGPGLKGWACGRYSAYPQELVFQFTERSRITKIQLLGHEHLIPSAIEIYIGDVQPGKDKTYYNASFQILGCVYLSENEHAQFKARELKTINVECTGLFLKFVFQKNHMNKLNIHNQVALVAVNFFGEFLKKKVDSAFAEENGYSGHKRKEKEHTRLKQDLAFSMYVDVYVSKTIKQIDEKRKLALKEKRLDYAKKLERVNEYLIVEGEKLGKLEIQKRQSIDAENFDKAKAKKKQLENYRVKMFKRLNLDDLLEIKGKRLEENDDPDFQDDYQVLGDSQLMETMRAKEFSDTPKRTPESLPPARPAHTPPRPPPSPPRAASPRIKSPTLPLPGLGRKHRDSNPISTPRQRSKKVFVEPPADDEEDDEEEEEPPADNAFILSRKSKRKDGDQKPNSFHKKKFADIFNR